MLLTWVAEQKREGFGMFQKRNSMSRTSEAGMSSTHLGKGQQTCVEATEYMLGGEVAQEVKLRCWALVFKKDSGR